MPKLTIEQQLLSAGLAINNALTEADILADLSPFGYDQAKLKAGKTLLSQAEGLVEQQKVEYGEQHAASQALQSAWDAAEQAYSRSLKVARVAFKGNSKARTALELDGRRKKSLSGWLGQAQTFYGNLLSQPDLLPPMKTFGYNQAKLKAEKVLVEQVAQANAQQEAEKGEAQAATKQRDAALDTLDEWLDDFQAIAEVALADSPQRLEKLGFGAVA